MSAPPRAHEHAPTGASVQGADDRTALARVRRRAPARATLPLDGGGDVVLTGEMFTSQAASGDTAPSAAAARCPECGVPLPQRALTGRLRLYCKSPRCRKAAHRRRQTVTALVEGLLVAARRHRSSPDAERPGCDVAGCMAPAMVEVDAARAASRLRYCERHARLVHDMTKGKRRLRRVECCAWCGRWAAADLRLQRAGHARPLCGPCAALVEELGEAARP